MFTRGFLAGAGTPWHRLYGVAEINREVVSAIGSVILGEGAGIVVVHRQASEVGALAQGLGVA